MEVMRQWAVERKAALDAETRAEEAKEAEVVASEAAAKQERRGKKS